MTYTARAVQILATIALLVNGAAAQTGPGTCHPYPGATAPDCLELIGNNLNSESSVTCNSSNGRATISLRNCAITTACAQGVTSVDIDTMVRRSLTAIGSCALNDHGSISGYYIDAGGSKTCYLYPDA